MENTNPSGSQKPNIKLIGLAIVAIILIIIAVVVLNIKSTDVNNNEPKNNQETEMTPDQDSPAPVNAEVAPTQNIPEGSRVEIVGANPVKDNVVITPTGQAVKNDAIPMSPEAPQQTAPIAEKELPSSAVKLKVASTGWTPGSFEVKAGSVVTLSVTSADTNTHVFMFDDASLSAVAIGVGPAETRAITFNAPAKAGEYTFRCDVPGHASRGEVGKMIVK